jgi:SAM-dependent methyltransferase
MVVHWVVDGISGSPDAALASELASNRYRVALPAKALRESGCEVELISAGQWSAQASLAASVVVIGKLLPRAGQAAFQALSQSVLAGVRACKSAGVPVVADFNDDHFGTPGLQGHWIGLAETSSVCVVSSDAMATVVRRYTANPIHVVGDPIASPHGTPKTPVPAVGQLRRWMGKRIRALAPPRLKLVWYGHPSNWPSMRSWMQDLVPLANERPFLLWLVTRPTVEIHESVARFNQQHGPGVLIEVVEWDEKTQWDVVRDSDIVLIPSDPKDAKKLVKTANRLTDALHMGRSVVASPVPAYIPYEDCVSLTDRPLDAIREILENGAAARDRVLQGQGKALARSGLPAIAQRWREVLGSIAQPSRQPGEVSETGVAAAGSGVPEHTAKPVRLNLGCGDKILPGYINVDVVESRAGKRPDVLCDLHDLSVFSSNHADEILSVHVVEHFWRWEIEDVLREWVRVLKPGGQLVVECPNLLSACEEFLKNPDTNSLPTREGQRTMWVFYGDPAWKDPYMIQRWGYTPNSLKALLESVGLVDVRQMPAQYKLREPRDMRVVGFKAREG